MQNVIGMFSNKLNEFVSKAVYNPKDELVSTETTGMFTNFKASFMPYEESRPNYEKGFEKYVNSIEQTQKQSEVEPEAEIQLKPEVETKTIQITDTTITSETINLKKELTELSKSVDKSISKDYKKDNENMFTSAELYMNIEKMISSSNPEIAGIGNSLSDLFKELGVDLWKNDSNNPDTLSAKYDDSDTSLSNIVMRTIIAAIKGDELDPADDGTTVLAYMGKQTGLTLDELSALDKNGDGSIVEELSVLLKNPEFINTCKFKIQRQKNETENNKNISRLDREKGGNGDGTITEAEIKAQFGQNEIAELFKTSSGSVDRSLLLALGAIKQKDGTYSINVRALKNTIYNMDANRDGKITKEEVEKFKNSQYFKQVMNFYL